MRFVLVLALVAGCSIEHVSDVLACHVNTDCASGRSCVGGYCVLAAGEACPGACSTCDLGAMTCMLDGSMSNNGRVTCPAGWNCNVTCTGGGCDTIDCSAAASCAITCSGSASCSNVQCGAGRCQVTCTGANSCRSVECQNACACDVACTGPGACSTSSRCPDQACHSGSGCTSAPAGCNAC